MNVNFITAADVQEAKQQGRMVQIKCQDCNSKNFIGNHLSIITDHIKSSLALHHCSSCGAKTEIHPKDLSEIRNILKISVS